MEIFNFKSAKRWFLEKEKFIFYRRFFYFDYGLNKIKFLWKKNWKNSILFKKIK